LRLWQVVSNHDEATKHSNIDLVVMFRKLDNAWRESFVFQDWLVEYAHIENGYNQFGHKAPPAFATPDATLEMLIRRSQERNSAISPCRNAASFAAANAK